MTIEVSKEDADLDFVEELVDRVKRFVEDTIYSREADILAWSNYINENIKMFSRSETPIDVEEILLYGVDNIIYEESPKKFIIKIKENIYIKNVLLDVENFCKMINYGNLSMPGTNIFTKTFDDTKRDMDKLIELYYNGEII